MIRAVGRHQLRVMVALASLPPGVAVRSASVLLSQCATDPMAVLKRLHRRGLVARKDGLPYGHPASKRDVGWMLSARGRDYLGRC